MSLASVSVKKSEKAKGWELLLEEKLHIMYKDRDRNHEPRQKRLSPSAPENPGVVSRLRTSSEVPASLWTTRGRDRSVRVGFA